VAEAGKFDFLFVADSVYITEKSSPHYLNRFEPLTILGRPGGRDEHIGLVGTLTVSYSEPYNVARSPRSTTSAAGARAGTSSPRGWKAARPTTAAREHYAHDVRYRLAGEYLDVVQGFGTPGRTTP
jgi:alkanesulfonate monooxygenase SsuD/methylene tetrahydromethanopterin reductase-like flavin-dependent oxidoreductase (luciferase family)